MIEKRTHGRREKMPTLRRKRLGGLWKKDTPAGQLLSGKFSQSDIQDALAEVEPATEGEPLRDIEITIWLNKEEDRRDKEKSPHASLYFGEKYQQVAAAPLTAEDIPF
tara:strand:- start:570 stop:893 length:324 start_codon:yes stop_codon:yes gene_type:complete